MASIERTPLFFKVHRSRSLFLASPRGPCNQVESIPALESLAPVRRISYAAAATDTALASNGAQIEDLLFGYTSAATVDSWRLGPSLSNNVEIVCQWCCPPIHG